MHKIKQKFLRIVIILPLIIGLFYFYGDILRQSFDKYFSNIVNCNSIICPNPLSSYENYLIQIKDKLPMKEKILYITNDSDSGGTDRLANDRYNIARYVLAPLDLSFDDKNAKYLLFDFYKKPDYFPIDTDNYELFHMETKGLFILRKKT